jgi:hypothetical protein
MRIRQWTSRAAESDGAIRSIPIKSADQHRRASHFLPNFFHKLNGAFSRTAASKILKLMMACKR